MISVFERTSLQVHAKSDQWKKKQKKLSGLNTYAIKEFFQLK